MSSTEVGPISEQHGTAEREVGDIGTNVTAGNVSAGGGENSFEVVPPSVRIPSRVIGTTKG